MSEFNLPHWLQKKNVYYGYVVLVVGTLGVISSIPGQTMGISVFTNSLLEALDITRTELSLCYFVGTVTSAFMLGKAGRLLDHWGARKMAVLASLMLAFFLSMTALSPVISLKLKDLFHSDSSFWSFLVITICFLGVRHFGQGQMTLISRTMMGLWFEKRRGFYLGISGLFVAFGFGIAPVFLNWMIEKNSWQTSLYWLSLFLLLMSGVAFFFYRRSPESCGLKIDGGFLKTFAAHSSESFRYPQTNEYAMNLNQVKKKFTFWAFNFGMVAQAFLITAITFHMSRIGELHGMTSVRAFSVFLPAACISTIADLIGGYYSDRIPLKYLLFIMQASLTIGLSGLLFFSHSFGYALVAIGLGISGGLFAQLTGAAWPKLFGRTHLGSIAGYSMAWMVFGSSLGPFYLSFGGDNLKYLNALVILGMLLPASIAIASFWAHSPKEKVSQ